MAGPSAEERIRACVPVWTAVEFVRDVTGSTDRVLYHAGPPFDSPADIPAPVMNSLAVAAVYEGWATDFAAAREAIHAGEIGIAGAQDHRLLVPLAGVLSPSMAVVTVADCNDRSVRMHCAVNEGNQHATRLGKLDKDLPSHLRWLNGPFASWLSGRLSAPVELAPIIRAALASGDDCHARTMAGSKLLAALLLDGAGSTERDRTPRDFLDAAPAFALSLWMATAALCLRRAEGCDGSAIVTRAGGNGHAFGIQLASRPGHWFTAPAPVPSGAVEAAHAGSVAAGALGDSAVVDFFGLGGQSLDAAPALMDALAASLPADARDRPRLCLGKGRADMGLQHCAADARACATAGKGPLILIGMIDAAGEAGRIGGGVIDVDGAIFRMALA